MEDCEVSTDDTFGTTGYAADFTNNGLMDIVVTKERDTNNTEYFNPRGTRMYVNDGISAINAPECVKNVTFEETEGTLTIHWEKADNAPANVRYNVVVNFEDGSEYSLVPADFNTGFIKLAEGRQVLLNSGLTSYTLDLTGRKLNSPKRSLEDGKLVQSVSVQAVSPVTGKGSLFVGKDKEGNPTGIEAINTEDAANCEYFNLQGMRVANPVKGQIYIVRQGTKVAKAIF